MKESKLIKLLSSANEDEVFIEVDGRLCDIATDLGHEEESFDGFCSVYPAMVYLKPIEE